MVNGPALTTMAWELGAGIVGGDRMIEMAAPTTWPASGSVLHEGALPIGLEVLMAPARRALAAA